MSQIRDGLEYEGRNLFRPNDTARKRESTTEIKVAPYSFYATDSWAVFSERFFVEAGEKITVSFWAKSETEVSDTLYTQRIGFTTEDGDTRTHTHGHNVTVTNEWTYYENTFTVAENTVSMDFYARSDTDGNNVWINALKIEKGTKATPWSPAPEDVQSTLETVNIAPQIHIADGQTDELIGYLGHKDVIFNEQVKNKPDQTDTFEFTALGNAKYTDKLTDMNRLIIPEEDGTWAEYVITTERKNRHYTNEVRIKSFASYQMLVFAEVIRPRTLTGYTASQALGFLTNGTEWTPGIVESNAVRTFHIENLTDPLSFLKTVANEFELEMRFRVEVKSNRIVKRYIDLLERIGEWRGREITFGKDLESIERTVEYDNIVTKLICLGPEDEDGNRLELTVEDEDALQRWGRPHPATGELMHRIDVYEPTSDRSDMTEAELRQYGRTELNKRINSVVSYEAEIVDLENVSGMENKIIRFGDTVRIKDRKFNPALFVEARIFEQRRDIFTKSNKQVKLGDFVEYKEEELLAIIADMKRSLSIQIQARIHRDEIIKSINESEEEGRIEEDRIKVGADTVFENGENYTWLVFEGMTWQEMIDL